uniref:Uncharacterized protein n=1 Tax=Ditylum brightwellii TaxID=49249 RepID=A0A7S4RSY6_9STRA
MSFVLWAFGSVMALMMVEVLRRRLKKKGEKPDVPLDSSVDGSYNDESSESDFSDPPIGYCGSESESESEYEYEDEEQHRSSNYASRYIHTRQL